MATSIQVVHERTRIFNDSDLVALVCLMEAKLESSGGDYPALRSVVPAWQADLVHTGPGTIDLRLEQLTSSSLVRDQLRAILAAIADDLKQLGATVPAVVLNERCRIPGTRFFDYSTARLAAAIVQMTELLEAS